MKLPDIAACMIVKNEEHSISRCLDSLIKRVTRICIVDTGSTDETATILKHYTKAHIHTSWRVEKKEFTNFSEMRNRSLDMAGSAKWILIIDADEIITRHSWVAIHNLLFDTKHPPMAIALPRHQWDDLEMTTQAAPYPDYHVRIWQNGFGIHYKGSVHEQPVGFSWSQQLVYFDNAHIEHFNRVYLDEKKWKEKNAFYRSLGQR